MVDESWYVFDGRRIDSMREAFEMLEDYWYDAPINLWYDGSVIYYEYNRNGPVDQIGIVHDIHTVEEAIHAAQTESW